LFRKKSSRVTTKISTASIFKGAGRETSLWIANFEKRNPKTTLTSLRQHNIIINGLLENKVEFEERKNGLLLFFIDRLNRTRKEYENVRKTLV
jgi:hypothetical protein